MSTEDVAISVKGVSKYFKPTHSHGSIKQVATSVFKKNKSSAMQSTGYWALKDVSFDIKKGEFFGIVGKNGSGKSTLLKMMAGVYNPTKGSVAVSGRLIPFIELGVGFNPELSGRDNVFLNGALLGFNRKEMTSMYEEIVQFAELQDHMDVKLKNFSSGMQVRLAFSIAVRAKADILLIDEVLAVGDAAFQQKCFDYFYNLKDKKKTVVFVTHDMNSVMRFCTRAVYIDEGHVTMLSTPQKIADNYIFKNIIDTSIENIGTTDKIIPTSTIIISTKKISGSIVDILFTYKTKETVPVYVGFSILKDGATIAEMNSSMYAKIAKDGQNHIKYSVDTRMLNGGAYEVSGVLFTKDTKKILASTTARSSFALEGHDVTRGGGLRLEDSWSQG